jgi:hypothetical protein
VSHANAHRDIRQVGNVLASNGTLTSVRFTTPPPSTEYGRGVFQLVDKYAEWSPGWPVPKQLCCVDVTSNMFPAVSSGTAIYPTSTLMHSAVSFTNLILAQCPQGASFEIDLA